ncbi:MAG: DNA mismatch repair endonuclease MutL [Ruminococcaceae bacterium]|nr:DNA mismatch repair endonuclease MutL [Oscillospiraceae bacterium]
MGIINQLDISIANLIAAGEVVDRPASVIKELMENSIDAGATEITVEIKNGGVSFMRVSDNGCGMSEDDAVLCLSRHATSKIATASDLDAIMTLGFRGEALAAISSVSKLRIMTRREGDGMGTLVVSEGGVVKEVVEAGCKKGTTIIVEQLFANIPARRKFLKNDRSEGMAVAAVIEKIALSVPDVSIKFISDNVQKLMTNGDGKLYNTVYSIFGRDFAKKLIEVDSMSEGISVRGYIGRPDNVRANRNFQNFFINSRYIKSRTASAALEQAFSSYIESEKFPCCILFIDIHPAFVDVNVHPTKLEIKFSNERAVFEAIYCAVKNAVSNDSSRNEMLFERSGIPPKAYGTYNSFVPVYDRLEGKESPVQVSLENAAMDVKKGVDTVPYDDVTKRDITKSETSDSFVDVEGQEINKKQVAYFESNNNTLTSENTSKASLVKGIKNESDDSTINDLQIKTYEPKAVFDKTENDRAPISHVNEKALLNNESCSIRQEKPLYKYLGVVFNTYIIIEYEDKMMIIDKHAAHERIIFEQMQANRENSEKHMQILLLPIRLDFSKEEISACESFGDEIKEAGFDFEIDYALGAVSLLALPGGIDEDAAVDLFSDILSRLSTGTGSVGISRGNYFEKSLYQASCKAAMKGGRIDGEEHMRYIIDTLLSNPKIRYCPHGRPVMFELAQSTIEHKFKRT